MYGARGVPIVSLVAASLAPAQQGPEVGEDRHAAAFHRQASRDDTRLGAEGRDHTENRDREEEEAVREGEAVPP